MRLRSIFGVTVVFVAQSIPLIQPDLAFGAPNHLAPVQAINANPDHRRLSGSSLNLSSTRSNASSTLLSNGGIAVINLGGSHISVNSATKLTAAERVAVWQVMQTGQQSLLLNASGTAYGGSMVIGNRLSSNISNLVIPHGVTVVDISSLASLNVAGKISDMGSLFLTTSNHAATSFSVNADKIYVGPSGLISTMLPASNQYANLGPANLGLALNAVHDLVNAGTISSAATLNINAGGSITNALPTGTPGSQPLMQALSNITLLAGSGHLTNTGTISSTNGSINIAALSNATNLLVTARGGTFQALQGDINLRDAAYAGAANLYIDGGNYLSQNLNLNAGTGTIDAITEIVTGNLNSRAGVEHFAASTPTLVLCNNTISGDPTFVNSSGNIIIDGINSFSEDVAILASADITAVNDGAISAHGKNVTLIAGAGLLVSSGNFDFPGGTSISGGSGPSELTTGQSVSVNLSSSATGGVPGASGGSIDLSSSAAPVVIDTSTNSGVGGNVVLAAFANGATGGKVNLNTATAINTFGDTQSAGGNVAVIAGASPASAQTTIQLGAITTGGAGQNSGVSSGSVNISTSQPHGSNGPSANVIVFNSSGALSQGQISASAVLSVNAGVTTGAITTAGEGGAGVSDLGSSGFAGGNGGNVTIKSGGDLSVASVASFGGGGGGAAADGGGGSGGAGGALNIHAGGSINVTNDLNSSGGGGGGGGLPTNFQPSSGGLGGSAGSITIGSTGGLTISGVVLAASGGDGLPGQIIGFPSAGAGGASLGGGGGGGAGAVFTGASGGSGTYGGGGGGSGSDFFLSPGGGGGGGYNGGGGGGAGIAPPAGNGSGGGGGGGTGATGGSNPPGSGAGGAGSSGGGAGGSTASGGGDGGAGGVGGTGAGGAGAGFMISSGKGGDSGSNQSSFGSSNGSTAGSGSVASGGIVSLSGATVSVNGTLTNGGIFDSESINAQGSNGTVAITSTNGSVSVSGEVTAPVVALSSTNGDLGTTITPILVFNFNGGVTLTASATGLNTNIFLKVPEHFVSSTLKIDNSTNPISANSVNITNMDGDIVALSSTKTAIASPNIHLSAQRGNIGDFVLAVPVPLNISSGGGNNVNLIATATQVSGVGGAISIADNATGGETLTIDNAVSLSFANVFFQLVNNKGNILQSNNAITAIRSASIDLQALNGNVGISGGGEIRIDNNGTNFSLFARAAGTGSAGNVSLIDDDLASNESLILNNLNGPLNASGQFQLTTTNADIISAGKTTAIVAPNVALKTQTGSIGGLEGLAINNAGHGLTLLAIAGGAGSKLFITDDSATPESITIDNSSVPSSAAGVFQLLAAGSIIAASGAKLAITSDIIELNASAGSIGTGAAPLLVAASTSGLSLNAVATGTGTGQGNVFITDNAGETVTIGGHADGSFNLVNGNGNIEGTGKPAIAANLISLTALGGNISDSSGLGTPFDFSSINSTTFSLAIKSTNVAGNGGAVFLADSTDGAVTIVFSNSSPLSADVSFSLLTGSANVSVVQANTVAITSPTISFSGKGNWTADGTATGAPILVNSKGFLNGLTLNANDGGGVMAFQDNAAEDMTLGGFTFSNLGMTLAVHGGQRLLNNNAPIQTQNGPINLLMDSYDLTAVAPGSIIVDAGNSVVAISPVSTNVPLTIGSKTTGISLDAGDLDSINAGVLRIGSVGNSAAINVTAALSLSNSYDLSLIGGTTSFSAHGNDIHTIGGFEVSLVDGPIVVANINASADQGTVSLSTGTLPSATGSITVSPTSSLPVAHNISLLAGNGTLAFNSLINTITPLPDLANNGGSVSISARNLLTITGLVLNVDAAAATGNGGSASYINTDTAPLTVSTANVTIHASGANAGAANISSYGDLNFSQTSGVITANATGDGLGLGGGATITLTAGNKSQNQLGNLLVTGSLLAAGNGTRGSGGSITLGSNSATAFTIGSTGTIKNGIKGTLDVSGSGALDGAISVMNSGGGIIDSSQALTSVSSVTLSTAGAASGTLTISKPIGSAGTNSITLNAGGSGLISVGTIPLVANSLVLSSGTGAITANAISASSISANTGGKAAVNLTNTRIGTLILQASSAGASAGGTFSLTNNGGDIDSASISAFTSVTLKTVLVSSNIFLSGPITTSATGKVSLTATGAGIITDSTLGNDAIQGQTVTLTTGSAFGSSIGTTFPISNPLRIVATNIALNSTGNVNVTNLALTPLTVTSASSNGAFFLATGGAMTFVPSMTKAQVVGLTASGNITITGSIGNSISTTSVNVATSGANNITGTGTISAAGTVTLTTGTGSFGLANAPLKLNAANLSTQTNTAASLINLSDSFTGPIAVSQLSSSGSLTLAVTGFTTWGALSGASVAVKALGNTLFTLPVSAATGAVSITESGTGTVSFASGANISAATTVSVTSAGVCTLHDITTTNGSITIASKGATSVDNLVAGTTGATPSNISITQNGPGALSYLSASAAGTITISGSGTGITVGTTGAGKTISIQNSGANGGVAIEGTLSAPTSITLKATGTGTITTGGGGLIQNAALMTLTTGSGFGSGIGDIVTGPLKIKTTVATTLAANSVGGIAISNSGTATLTVSAANSTLQPFSLLSDAAVVFTPTLPSATSIIIDTSTNHLGGGITLNGLTLGGTTNTGAITVKTESGAILSKGVLTTNAGGSVTLHSNTGNIGSGTTSSTAIKINTPFVQVDSTGVVNVADSRTGTGAGAIQVSKLSAGGSLTFTSAGATVYGADISGSSVSITTAGTTSFNGDLTATATNGTLAVTETGTGTTLFNLGANREIKAGGSITLKTVGSTSLVPGAKVDANFANTAGVNGTILISESTGLLNIGVSSTFISKSATGTASGAITLLEQANVAGAGINIGNSSTFNTKVTTTTGSTFPLPGQISVVIGTTIPTNPMVGLTPQSNVSITQGTGINVIHWETTPITVLAPTNTLNVVGNSTIVFAAGTKAGITLGGNTSFTADPPVASSAALMHVPVPNASPVLSHVTGIGAAGMSASAAGMSASAAGMSASFAGMNANSAGTSNNQNINAVDSVKQASNSVETLNSLATGPLESFGTKTITSVASGNTTTTIAGSVVDSWISETELSDGTIPADLRSDTAFCVATVPCGNFDITKGHPEEVLSMSKGSILFAPKNDTTITTQCGNVKVSAGSVVLLLSFSNGIAVYDLDDQHKSAVTVSSGNREFNLYPGNSVVITSKQTCSFEEINPAQLFAYRNIVRHETGTGLQTFCSDFSIPLAFQTILPLRQLLHSNNSNAQRLIAHLLKTAAATMQVKSGGQQYQQMPHPLTAAWNQ